MSHTITAKLYDLQTDESADISSIALTKSMSRRLNLTRSMKIEVPAGHALVTDVFGDGYPAMNKGDRKLLVWQDGEIIHHGRVFTVERVGDGTRNRAVITSFDPGMELGYDADDRAGRLVRDDTGNFISPTFNGGGEISGGDLIYQAFTNSQQTGTESDPNPGEGPLPIDLTTGDFDIDIPPAIDLSVIDQMPWPYYLGDFVAEITSTGVVDVNLRPIDPTEGLDPYHMCALSAVNQFGTDHSGTVHFDYWTGSKNASYCRHVADFATICNKLYDYLGPRKNQNQWRANITPGSPGTLVDPTDSRDRYGIFMALRIFDSLGTESSSRPMYIAAWNAEQGLRIEPRDMLFLTPAPDEKALFAPFTDYDVGDLTAVNVGGDFGLTLAEAQRIYGFDVTWSREGVQRVSELITSADAA
jgi:hypothetical protein